MAKITIRYLNVYRVFHWVLFLFVKAWHLLVRLKFFVTSNFYKISSVVSICLLVINIIIFTIGCQAFHSRVFSLNLPHGYLPTFPDHFFQSVVKSANQSGSSLNTLDNYLSHHVLHDSLTHSMPPVVHIICCNRALFTFANYLSVVGAFKMFKPSALYLHMNMKQEPELDPDGYFQFFPDLIRDIPVISTVKLKFPLACLGSIHEQKLAYFQIIGSIGGIAIDSKTLVAPSKALNDLLNYKLGMALLLDLDYLLMVCAHPGVLSEIPSHDDLKASLKRNDFKEIYCPKVNDFSFQESHSCAHVLEDIFPVQIFRAGNDFAALARWSGYGTSKKLISQPAEKEIVPNIVHYVWLGKRNFDFFAYLSLLSSLYVLDAEEVYIHGEEPLGELFSKLKGDARVKMINRDFPDAVYGDPIKAFVSHASDYLRADILLRYGGVYADWDVIFLQALPSSVRRHNATACVDWPLTGSFPDVLNLGVLVAAPGAQYLRFFLESYRWYLDNHWSYNAIHMPYKIYEKNPRTLNIDRHLQVLCANTRCHAAWIPGFKEDQADHIHNQRFNWQTDAVAIHWTYPDPVEFHDLKTLLASSSVEADIGRFILKKAKLIN